MWSSMACTCEWCATRGVLQLGCRDSRASAQLVLLVQPSARDASASAAARNNGTINVYGYFS